ncbi:MAG: hypothetical protein WA966_12895, partial [Ornithinimicrobium sp.]
EMTLIGPPGAEVTVEMRGRSLRTTLAEIADAFHGAGRIGIPAQEGALGRAVLQPSVGGLTSLGVRETRFEWTDPGPEREAFYYVRSYLVDGEMAWSSPVWSMPTGTRLSQT